MIEPIIPPPLPFGLDDKIFRHCTCEDDEECECKFYSINDFKKQIEDISGIKNMFLKKSND